MLFKLFIFNLMMETFSVNLGTLKSYLSMSLGDNKVGQKDGGTKIAVENYQVWLQAK